MKLFAVLVVKERETSAVPPTPLACAVSVYRLAKSIGTLLVQVAPLSVISPELLFPSAGDFHIGQRALLDLHRDRRARLDADGVLQRPAPPSVMVISGAARSENRDASLIASMSATCTR